jgi:hypothetical protein
MTCAIGVWPQQRVPPVADCACPLEATLANREGVEQHQRRRLTEASLAYSRALKAAPSRDPSGAEQALMLKFAPRVFVHPREPFPLKDAAAILHPEKPWIAYHFFWEDDIDFPDDNDPCDHELIWVKLDPRRERLEAFFTYFHGRILEATPAGIEEARRFGGRPRIEVQWGKHGSLPHDWRNIPIQADAGDVERRYLDLNGASVLETYQRATWKKLSTEGRDAQNSPLARGWPLRFSGSWEDFVNYSRPQDIAAALRRGGLLKVSCLNNAVINRQFLRYNFSAKTEWPPQFCR